MYGSNGFELLFLILFIFIVCLICILINVPARIAKNRGVSGNSLDTIHFLSWFGLFFGITWIVALIFALSSEGDDSVIRKEKEHDLYILEKAYDLMKKGVISEKEYKKLTKDIVQTTPKQKETVKKTTKQNTYEWQDWD